MAGHWKFPRLRFSLRTLLIVVTLGTIVAWLGPTTVTVLRRNSMRQKIVREGGKFEFFDDSRPEIAESWGSRAPLRLWLGDKWANAVDLNESSIELDEVCEIFHEASEYRGMNLGGTVGTRTTRIGCSIVDGKWKCAITSVPTADATKPLLAAPE
jgi:hypothetical protein